MPRLFVAIDLPDAAKDQILNLREDDLPPGRWTCRAGLHLTVQFIGETTEPQARRYKQALQQVAVPAFALQIGGVGQFPVDSRPRVIWAGVDNTPELRALHDATGRALQDSGHRLERRRFHPHITLMRFKKPLRRGLASRWLQRHLDFYIEPFSVREFALYESQLRSGGAVYTKRGVYALASS
ncbi:MAG: RNA 2',3'-cyclic phosphodiesterase [Chloroflexi bacterium]|nr:RNA 2',3'-cyclic phosphodiesterase [Chloroflexota bacterium]MCY4247418.1 RNA 2',3'-cyclic phosphodiesterase [Chloroflexota bacterium]